MKLIFLLLNLDFYVTCLCLDNIFLLYEDNKCCFVFDMCNLWREYYSHLAEEEYQLDKFNNVFKIYVNDFVQNISDSSFPEETIIPVTIDKIQNQFQY